MTTDLDDDLDAVQYAMRQAPKLSREEQLLSDLTERFKMMLKPLSNAGSFDEIGLHRQAAIDLIRRYRREVVAEASLTK